MSNEIMAASEMPPVEIIHAANLITTWTEKNGSQYWELCGIADRRFVYRFREIAKIVGMASGGMEKYDDEAQKLIPHATRNQAMTFHDALQAAKEIIGRFADGSPTIQAQAAARSWADLDYTQESFRVK